MSSKNNIHKAQSTPQSIKVMYWSPDGICHREQRRIRSQTWAICGQWYLNTLALQAAENEKAQVDASNKKGME